MTQSTKNVAPKKAAPKKVSKPVVKATEKTAAKSTKASRAKATSSEVLTNEAIALEDFAPAAMSNEQREEMVRYAAYHLAEKDGFQAGRESDYWFQAQEQVDQLLNGIQSPSAPAVKSNKH